MNQAEKAPQDEAPKLTRDVFEFKDEFKKRLEKNGPYLAGTASLLKDKYDIEKGCFPLEIKWNAWVNVLNPVNNGLYIIANRDFAKDLYESSLTHSIFVHLIVSSENVSVNGISLSGTGEFFTVEQTEDEEAWQEALQHNTAQSYETYLTGKTLKRYLSEAQKKYEEVKEDGGEKEDNFFEFELITVNSSGEISLRECKQVKYHAEDLGNDITLEMNDIPGGTFLMGTANIELSKDEDADESPAHEVTVKPFHLSKYPITQGQWKAVMGNNPSFFRGDKRPVERVLWHDAIKFCQKLSDITGHPYRLPSEAEWEYACRANTTSPFHYGDTITTELVNYNAQAEPNGIFREETTNVGSFPSNAFGLYDMHGNVYEWCADPWHDNYKGAPAYARVWEEGGVSSKRILRGGSWLGTQWYCRCTTRNWLSTVNLYDNVGFRVALNGSTWT